MKLRPRADLLRATFTVSEENRHETNFLALFVYCYRQYLGRAAENWKLGGNLIKKTGGRRHAGMYWLWCCRKSISSSGGNRFHHPRLGNYICAVGGIYCTPRSGKAAKKYVKRKVNRWKGSWGASWCSLLLQFTCEKRRSRWDGNGSGMGKFGCRYRIEIEADLHIPAWQFANQINLISWIGILSDRSWALDDDIKRSFLKLTLKSLEVTNLE